ncbi:WecB/TagA/CpsF family glycosyltransferase [Xinfangfangia sp. CPCC 101601]|uniref:WecB/TagA/CpsF family glycosyltransferase n=1 Tax=Pseudogemmobacter lacusdianii TaxID=3069608 RepID=A0ABU0VWU4_9RHOB|nr:WecB/TagA/CpsF family glycosyltransferase [Xinfangfangia sp. CPCC 101601]MDQ2066230.1 WecB/TagA/CpsF family glycosyltransferase [Xinfangfangia sp. CPCC 101601]
MHFDFGMTRLRITHSAAALVLADAALRLKQGRGFGLATINLDHLVKLRRDPAFLKAYAAQDFVVADGNPIVWLARLAGHQIGLVPGSDLMLPLVQAAAAAGRPVSILGSTEPALEAAMRRLQAQVPGLQRGLLIAPPMGFDPEGQTAHEVLQLLAPLGGLCLVALGAPKQERLAALGRKLAPSVGFASIGAGVDFVAGTQKRAPRWMRAIAMEWLWRALSSPRRLVPRYATCAAILPGQALQALRQRITAERQPG